ncbi:WD40 repeat-like protein [Paxillus ammoniavirescens]|nr:WD40 repeat-like protein [Paxillus ammoniavirescens]
MAQFYETTKNAYRHVRGLPKPPLVLLGHTHAVWSVAFLPDGKEVISGSEDRSARRWRVQDGRELEKAAMWENNGVAAVAASSDGHWIATGGQEKNITIWNAATCEKVMVLKGHTDCVRSLAFSPDSARVVSGSEDKTVIVWSATTGKRLLGPLIGHTYKVWCARFSPNGDKIASCDGGGGKMRIWNGHSGKLLLLPIEVFAASIAWTPDNQQLIVGCKDGSIKRFSALTGSLLADWKSHTDIICSIAISPNGTFFASASNDRTVRLWDTTTPTQISPPLQCDDQVCSVAISPAGTHLASGGRDNKVRIWNLTGTVSPSLLKGKPTTSNITVRSKWSPSSPTFVMPVQQEVSSSPNDRSLEPPAPQNIIPNGKGEDPDSSVLLASDGGASSGSSKAQTPREPTQPAPWNLEDIRSNFPNDLTGSVTRRGDHPLASGSYGDVYRGTLHVRGSQIEVAVKAIRTYSADDGYDPGKTRRLNREIGVWLNLKHINILPLFGTTMGFGQFPAMVCPWLEDGPLTSYLQRRDDSLTTVERLVLVADVAVGLQYRTIQSFDHGHAFAHVRYHRW